MCDLWPDLWPVACNLWRALWPRRYCWWRLRLLWLLKSSWSYIVSNPFINVLSICLVLLAGVTEENSTVQIEPYISYGLIAWEQAANSSLNRILILQKRALRLMYFSDSRANAIPLFVRSGVLHLNMLYFKYSVILMHDISNNRAPSKFLNRSSVLTWSPPDFLPQVIFMSRDLNSTSYYYLFLEVVSEFGTNNKILLTLREQRKDPFERKLFINFWSRLFS